ncbi:MAG: hypothetical protein LBU68_00410 [Rickettsiales bacterium]|jgi:hypothetical protein|nr:hypothetical protein [Rickettsiales bacterium]
MEKLYKMIIILFVLFLTISNSYAGYHDENRKEFKDKNIIELNVEDYYGTWIPDENDSNCKHLIGKMKKIIQKDIFIYEMNFITKVENPLYIQYFEYPYKSKPDAYYSFWVYGEDNRKENIEIGALDGSFSINDDLRTLIFMRRFDECRLIKVEE